MRTVIALGLGTILLMTYLFVTEGLGFSWKTGLMTTAFLWVLFILRMKIRRY